MLHVYVYTCTHAYVEFHVYVYAHMHARMRRLVRSGDGTYVRRRDHGRREAKYARAHS